MIGSIVAIGKEWKRGVCTVKRYNRRLLRRKLEEIQKIEVNQLMDEIIAKNKIYDTFTAKEINIIEDEYYTNISKLEEYIGNYDRKINKIQIDRLCWIVTICK